MKTTLGVLVGNRGFFPAHLCESGRKEIPLRSTLVRGGNAPVEFRRSDESGRISVVLYVDEDTALDAP